MKRQQQGRYETRYPHDPNGTGKFYMGREIAQVMGHQAADWLDRPEREAEEAPSLLLKSLGLKPGMVVADIGAGSGYLTFPMARKVAPKGKVFAVDIQPEMLTIIKDKAQAQRVKNVVVVLGETADPKLPEASCDLQLLVDVYHELDQPYEMALAMKKALKPGGRLVLVEYRKEDPNVPIKEVHKMSVAQVRKELAVVGLTFERNIKNLPWQHILVFRK
jgi:ubiquinone/menaquinone biosynthesis C-methylase UbiE